jgi:hypothetical protein
MGLKDKMVGKSEEEVKKLLDELEFKNETEYIEHIYKHKLPYEYYPDVIKDFNKYVNICKDIGLNAKQDILSYISGKVIKFTFVKYGEQYNVYYADRDNMSKLWNEKALRNQYFGWFIENIDTKKTYKSNDWNEVIKYIISEVYGDIDDKLEKIKNQIQSLNREYNNLNNIKKTMNI